MFRIPDVPEERGTRCVECGRGMIVPNATSGADGYVCEACDEKEKLTALEEERTD